MSVETIAQKWHNQLLRADPIDHSAGEAAIRSVYRSAGLPAPRFLWCASPHEAVWAVLVLVGKVESYNHAVYEDVERSVSGQQQLDVARASVSERLGIAESEVEGYFGMPFYRAEGTNPVTEALHDGYVEAIMARADAGDDFLAIHDRGPFKPLHDLEHALLYEAYRNRDGALRPSLIREAILNKGGKHVEILGGRSAHHRLYGSMAYSEVAVDEALAESNQLVPTELQRAMWAAYEACGMWWPCDRGVIVAERPVNSERVGEGTRLTWSDGFGFVC